MRSLQDRNLAAGDAWTQVTRRRQLLHDATCPLERVAHEAGVDYAVMLYLAWSVEAERSRPQRLEIAAWINTY